MNVTITTKLRRAWQSAPHRLALLACVSTLSALPNIADTLYDNGPINASLNGRIINGGLAVADSFTLANRSSLNGAQVGLWTLPGDYPVSLDWSIGSNPDLSDFGSATVVPTDHYQYVNPNGYWIFEVDFALSETLPAGTYWLTLQNAAVPSGDYVFWDQNNGPSQAWTDSQGLGAGCAGRGASCSESFQIFGTVQAVPEPGTGFLVCAALLLICGLARKPSTRRLSSLFARTCAMLCLPAISSADTVTIFSDLGPPPADLYQCCNGSLISGSGTRFGLTEQAAEFTSAADFDVTDIYVAVDRRSGNGTGSVELITDHGGMPGDVIGSWRIANLGSNGSCCKLELVFRIDVFLAAGSYFLAVTPGGTNSWQEWQLNSIGAVGTTARNQGNGWVTTQNAMLAAFELDGTPVPEPSWAIAIGVVTFLCMALRASGMRSRPRAILFRQADKLEAPVWAPACQP